MNLLKIICLITVFINLTFQASAANLLGKRYSDVSKVLGEKRDIQVLLPEGYYSDPNTHYPVIYLLDGDYNFNSAAGMLDFMANKGQLIPDVILVGIADKGTDKYRQYMTPKGLTAPLKQDDAGKADVFLSYLTDELKPFVESNFRTSNNHILFGHSIAGLFVLNTMIEAPGSFQSYLASSPSLWLNDHAFVKKAQSVVNNINTPLNLFLSLGDETRMGQYRLIDLLDDQQPKNINWHFKHYPDENHNSVAMISFRHSLKSMFSCWYIDEKTLHTKSEPMKIVNQYQTCLQQLNTKQVIPTPSIKAAVRYFYFHKQEQDIAQFLKLVKEKLPSSESAFLMMFASYAGHFDSPQSQLALLLKHADRFKSSIEYIKAIAVAYEKVGARDNALNSYQQAHDLAKAQQANQWQLNIINAKISALKALH